VIQRQRAQPPQQRRIQARPGEPSNSPEFRPFASKLWLMTRLLGLPQVAADSVGSHRASSVQAECPGFSLALCRRPVPDRVNPSCQEGGAVASDLDSDVSGALISGNIAGRSSGPGETLPWSGLKPYTRRQGKGWMAGTGHRVPRVDARSTPRMHDQ
jgi:hypothetical protein